MLLLGSQQPGELRVRHTVAPYAFRLFDWELGRLAERAGRIAGGVLGEPGTLTEEDRHAVTAYFQAAPQTREPLRPAAEAVVERALTAVLASEKVTLALPLGSPDNVVFPPVSFSFVSPPQVLVVSPRDRIAVTQTELLRPDISLDQIERVETLVDRRGVSSLVVEVGGLATYPAMVLEGTRPLDALTSVAHEWVHGYFFFHPLGRGYGNNHDARTINETAADMASRELGERLSADLGLVGVPRRASSESQTGQGTRTDFHAVMRSTRITVDALLAAGRVEEAETYMRDRRAELAATGYDIRKLNQAYFAFHGSYGDAAAGASPIRDRLRRLREASPSVGDFLRRVAQLTSGEDLARAVGDA